MIFKVCTGNVLTDFSLTVKAATLIFIPGRGWAISSAKQGNQDLYLDRCGICGQRYHCDLQKK